MIIYCNTSFFFKTNKNEISFYYQFPQPEAHSDFLEG